MTHVARALAAVALVAAVACKGRDAARPDAGTETGATAAAPAADTAVSKELKVAGVMIGKRIGENKLITEPTFQFAPDGHDLRVGEHRRAYRTSADLTAKWRFQTGQMVDSSTQSHQAAGQGEHRVPHLEPQGMAGRDLQRHHLRQRRLGGLEELRGEEVAVAGVILAGWHATGF